MSFKETDLIGQLLIQKGIITVEALERALAEQEHSQKRIGDILIKLGLVNENDFYRILSEQSGVEYIKLKDIKIDPSVINKIPAKFACHYELIPVEIKDDTITVAMSNPLDIHTIDDIRLLLKSEIRAVLASRREILEMIKKYYGVGAETIEKMAPDASLERSASVQAQETQDVGESAEDASIIKFVNQILLEGCRDRATDIHIEPYEDELLVRYRIDGILHETKVPQSIKHYQSAIISRIKIMANLDISERRLPQDGRIKIRIGAEEVDLRVSILPTPFGESVVIRILSGNIRFGLENLGLLKKDQDVLERLLKMPHGIIFVTGPTGSGKTTTLYASLSKINTKDRKIITIEDPIEYQLKGITQIQVQPKIELTFANALRSMLRHDPDVMMVGEVRDYETAEITIRVALTGHLVFSTIHTNDAAGGVTRLIDMGVEPFLVASAVECFIAQRLVRVICSKCKHEIKPDKELLRELGVSGSKALRVKIYEGKGCDACRFTGYKGRTAIYEILEMSEPIRELVLKRASSDQIKKKAIELGMRTLRQDGWEKIVMGMTTPSEVIRVTQQEVLEEIEE
ncbi:MAG: ATPase, T2SS/T4P/T4SS family [Candidatus Omnitrophica bacterium]|nr:ATPase, T2SS/T4P/T4SS family [Candidatus Omnitrophota bacterium]